MRNAIVVAVTLFLMCSCSRTKEARLPYFNSPDFTPLWINESDRLYKDLHTLPPFSFTDQNGQLVTEGNVKGRIYVADFFFTKCTGICPKMTTNMSKVSTAFVRDNDVVILSHTVAPDTDLPGVLKEYAHAKNINNSNWHLLTGDKESIYKMARKGYYADESLGYNKDTTEFLHTENFVLVDRTGRIRGVYNGTIELEVDRLIKHINMLKQEK